MILSLAKSQTTMFLSPSEELMFRMLLLNRTSMEEG
jgi:hypothetical protein